MSWLHKKSALRWLRNCITVLAVVLSLVAIHHSVAAQTLPEEPNTWNYLPFILGNVPPAVTPTPPSQLATSWHMVGANPQRTSRVDTSPDNQTEIRGVQQPVWYRVMDPYINQKQQLIAAYDTLYVSTASGVYALSTDDMDGNGVGGDIRWVYPTELPVGHSPTAVDGTLYIPGDDHKIHAIEATPDVAALSTDSATGYKINSKIRWIFEATPIAEEDGSITLGAGFDTNPLVVNNTVFAGNRNGYMYALNASTGELKWKYKTEGPILFSPAASRDNSKIFFASNDTYAYALDAATGALVWRAGEFPVAGFFAYWPVVYTDQPGTASEKEYVIFTGSTAYSTCYLAPPCHHSHIFSLQNQDLYSDIPAGEYIGPVGAEPGNWISGTQTVDASKIVEYYEVPSAAEIAADPAGLSRKFHKPWRRQFFVLDSSTGSELTLDPDSDGKPGYAPFTFTGTKSGNKYPPVLGGDGVLYQQNGGTARPYIPTGEIVGWKFGTQYISYITNEWGGWDEPEGYSVGGNVLYTFHNGDVFSEAIDLQALYPNNRWIYFNLNLSVLFPGYDEKYAGDAFGTINGVYSKGGTRVGPTPYKGKVYYMAGNSIIAFGRTSAPAVRLPTAKTVHGSSTGNRTTVTELKQRLTAEIQKMIAAGHLRPGYHSSGLADLQYASPAANYRIHYFHRPADTFVTLLRALPYLPTTPVNVRQQARDYLQSEFAAYGHNVHIGYKDGAKRESFAVPPETSTAMSSYGRDPYYPADSYFADHQYRYYGAYLYAKEFGNAAAIYHATKDALRAPPPDAELLENPDVHNAYIAGYIGFLGLQKLAGIAESATARSTLDDLLALRAANFTKDLAYTWEHPYNVAGNFINMVPELGEYLRLHALSKVQTALNEYQTVAPYWFVAKYDATLGEGAIQQLYDYPTIFSARAYILRQPREELVKYLDVPAFEVGDLFYIQNLVLAIEAPAGIDGTFPQSVVER